jgi:hypothetical protein
MRTLEDYPQDEFFARHTMALPYEEKLEYFVELCRVATLRGSPGIHDILDYLTSAENELLVTMIGIRCTISDEDLMNALLLFFLSEGEAVSGS